METRAHALWGVKSHAPVLCRKVGRGRFRDLYWNMRSTRW